ncbi:triose-phosphate isomerase [candidate division WOR-1 bacterium RIFCSPHIGHO2_02_FULL_45_12]|nr:MAG: triose-phosphate isomerase [candidate division WOR-1 bacterium RIFCSPHIGHO2_02_FULL_45_12]
MRQPLMAGNWKMFKNESETISFLEELKPRVADVKDRDILICTPFPNLSRACEAAVGSNINIGAQNIYWEDEGAFTGEVSGSMLKAIGCTYVIIGHSERRQYFGETDETVNKKIFAALKHNLLPIVCVGESLEQREKGETFKIIEKQIKNGLYSLEIGHWEFVIIAYEPVWAIGTGKTATPEQAQEVHAFIRGLLPAEVKDKIRILYGGSVKPDNVKELMAQPDIDGGLVGGASLNVESFVKLIKY